MKKIGITTIFTGNNNYGGVLQAYALQQNIRNMLPKGYDVEHINFEYNENPIYRSLLSRCKQYSLSQIINKFKEKCIERRTYLISDKLEKRLSLFDDFRNKYIRQSKKYEINEHPQIGKDYDILITGSDQVWNPNVIRDVFTFDFPTRAKKIAYAASISRNKLSNKEKEYLIPLISTFKHVGVREITAQKILAKEDINSKVVLDPTMLLAMNDWEKVSSQQIIKEPYVFVYSFSDCPLKSEIERYYKEKNIKVVYIPYVKMVYNKFDDSYPFEKIWNAGPSEFLSLIKNAEHVFTDSFHGTVFSILFNTPFTVYDRNSNAGKVNMNSRLVDLLKTFGLTERMSKGGLVEGNIDFASVNNKLELLRDDSRKWLYNSITD